MSYTSPASLADRMSDERFQVRFLNINNIHRRRGEKSCSATTTELIKLNGLHIFHNTTDKLIFLHYRAPDKRCMLKMHQRLPGNEPVCVFLESRGSNRSHRVTSFSSPTLFFFSFFKTLSLSSYLVQTTTRCRKTVPIPLIRQMTGDGSLGCQTQR